MKKELKYAHWFDSVNLNENLKNKSIKGGISTTGSQFISFGLNLLVTFVLARLLLPADFGLIAMVTAFTGFANIIKDMGLSMAVIQKEDISHAQVNNLFWITILVCFAIACIFIALSPLIVSLYNHDIRLYPIIFSYAGGVLISGFSLQHLALMNRKMLFTKIAKANIFASALSVISGISAALLGAGYWSIVVLNISMIAFNTAFVWLFCNWRPSLPAKGTNVKSFLHFGAGVSGFNIMNYFSRYSDDILIGNRLGPMAVGFYSKAYQLLMLPLNQLRNPLITVAIPALSALKNDPERYVNYYRRYVFLMAFFSMPLIAFLAIYSEPLILTVLGEQWMTSSRIFRILALAGFIQPVASSIGLVMISTGQSKRYFIWGCINSSVSILGFFIGIHWGITGTVVSLVITTYALLIPSLLYAFKGTILNTSAFFSEISLPAMHTMGLSCLLVVVKIFLGNMLPPVILMLCAAFTGCLFYYYSWRIYNTGKAKLSLINGLTEGAIQKIKTMLTVKRLQIIRN